jgi:pimeloyl-ACP methyl ester carboxylesterase
MGALEELEVSNPVVIGHSMGGAVTMDLALRFPAFPKGLILVGTGAKLRVLPHILDEIKENFVHAVESVCQIIFAKGVPKEMLQVATAEMLKTSPDVLHGDFSACDRFDIMEEVGNINNPTLIICGDQDALTPIKYSRYLAERISGSRLEVIEGTGHMVMLERPEQFNKKVETFVHSIGVADA